MPLTCPSCGNEEPEGSTFCGNCGASLASAEPEAAHSGKTVTCASCGNAELEGTSFCGNCGAPLVAAAPEPEPAHTEPEPAATAVMAVPAAPPQEPSVWRRLRYLPLVPIAVLLLLVVAGGAVALLTRGGGSSKKSDSAFVRQVNENVLRSLLQADQLAAAHASADDAATRATDGGRIVQVADAAASYLHGLHGLSPRQESQTQLLLAFTAANRSYGQALAGLASGDSEGQLALERAAAAMNLAIASANGGLSGELRLPKQTPIPSQSTTSSSAAGACSPATALEVGKPYFWEPNMSRPIGQVLCGPFTGPGSEAMVIAFFAPTCWPIQRWAVFRRTGGVWRLVQDVPSYLDPPLVVVGSDIRETTAVSRPGDSRCNPSGGSHARLWHWNGTRFTASGWQQVTPGTTTTSPSTGVAASGYFKTPTHNIVCYHSTGTTFSIITCGIKSGLRPAPPRRPCTEGDYAGDRVVLQDTGTVQVPSCAGDPGPFVGASSAPVLVYGKRWSGGGLRCTSRFRGLTCRNKSGHGFFLSRERWRSF